MNKLIFFVMIALAVYWLLRRPSRRDADSGRRSNPTPEPMVACARCGLHIPRSESVEVADRHYCCAEHRRLDAGDSSRG